MKNPINRNIFEDLFVLELANNHWGSLDRGIRIIQEFGRVARYNNVRAALKLQFRDVDNFIHPAFRNRQDIRYIKKTIDTHMPKEHYARLVEMARQNNFLRMATPFDEVSVEWCVEMNIDIVKIASSDINDWFLIEKIAKTKKPVIASTGGTSLKDTDDLVTFFANRNIPLALNHCVSLYPTEDAELELNQIDFLKNRYPHITIGFSTHEHHDWRSSIMIAYAKGARTFERHIDLNENNHCVASYCSLPEQIDEWMRAWRKAVMMCGASGTQKRIPPEREIQYLDSLVRGVYVKHDLPEGHMITAEDFFLAIPLQKGQFSCRELFMNMKLARPLKAGDPLTIDCFDDHYSNNPGIRELILERGLQA